MYEKIMKCDVCGMTFSTEYYENGYIDHVLNFSKNCDVFIKEADANRIIEAIVMHGNCPRDTLYIRARLACFKKWGAPTDLQKRVVSGVEYALKIIKSENEAVDKAIKKLTDSQKDLLRYQCDEKAFLSECNGAFTSTLRDDDGNFRIPPAGGVLED